MVLRYDTKNTNGKEKNRQIGPYQNVKLLCIKGHHQESEKTTHTIKKVKRHPTGWGKIFKNHIYIWQGTCIQNM